MRTALYRIFAAEGRLLYVGVSYLPDRRLEQHAATKFWWTEVGEVEVEWFANRDEAEAAERDAIHHENPEHNIARPWYWKPTRTKRSGFVHVADGLDAFFTEVETK